MKKIAIAIIAFFMFLCMTCSCAETADSKQYDVHGFTVQLPDWGMIEDKKEDVHIIQLTKTNEQYYDGYFYVCCSDLPAEAGVDTIDSLYSGMLDNLGFDSIQSEDILILTEKAKLWNGYIALDENTKLPTYGILYIHKNRCLIMTYVNEEKSDQEKYDEIEQIAGTIIPAFDEAYLSSLQTSEKGISEMSFSEIQEALDTYNLKLWETGNWSSVVVPTGIYVVGKDIPAGTYQVKSAYQSHMCSVYLWPEGEELFNWSSENPRYLEAEIKGSPYELTLVDGDQLQLDMCGLTFSISDYMPRFNVDQQQEDAVKVLREEYSALEIELRSRPEWKEIKVPEGVYEIGSKIPAESWTVWPPDEYGVISVYYGKPSVFAGEELFTIQTAVLKNASLSSFKFGFQNDRFSFHAKEGWFIKIKDGTVTFTPYAGITLFQFNE